MILNRLPRRIRNCQQSHRTRELTRCRAAYTGRRPATAPGIRFSHREAAAQGRLSSASSTEPDGEQRPDWHPQAHEARPGVAQSRGWEESLPAGDSPARWPGTPRADPIGGGSRGGRPLTVAGRPCSGPSAASRRGAGAGAGAAAGGCRCLPARLALAWMQRWCRAKVCWRSSSRRSGDTAS